MVVPGGDKEDHASVVQLDPGGMVAAVMEVEILLYEKGASAETMKQLIFSHLQPGLNVCFSRAKEKYE